MREDSVFTGAAQEHWGLRGLGFRGAGLRTYEHTCLGRTNIHVHIRTYMWTYEHTCGRRFRRPNPRGSSMKMPWPTRVFPWSPPPFAARMGQSPLWCLPVKSSSVCACVRAGVQCERMWVGGCCAHASTRVQRRQRQTDMSRTRMAHA